MTRRRLLLALGALVLLGAAGAGAAWWWNERATGDIRGSSTREFITTEQTTTRAEEEVESEPWPIYGLTPDRTRNAVDFEHEPPYRRQWVVNARQLLDNGHPKGPAITLDTALHGIAIPLHPGAERYYREVGLLE